MTELANSRQIRLARLSPFYWRVTFDHPPLNIFGPETIPQLEEIIQRALVDEAHQICPYSKATRGNIDVAINLV